MSETIAPTTYQGVIPYLMARGASDAIEFYKRAFGAEEVSGRMLTEDGKLMHAHIRVNGGDIMLSDEFPEHGHTLGERAVGVTLLLIVDDADAWWQRAVDAGAEIRVPFAEQFWGDRYGELRDAFGHTWSINQPKR